MTTSHTPRMGDPAQPLQLARPQTVFPRSVHVSVVVINLDGAHHLPRLLDALREQTYGHFELILVDNGSQDGSPELVESYCREHGLACTVMRNRRNRGFAPACNQALQVARGRWIALLNNDAWPEPDWLERLLRTGESGADVGMVAAKLLFAHAPQRINSAGIAIDRACIAWDWRGGELDRQDETEPVEVFGACGGAALYSRHMLEEIGGFDEDFFAYLEDVDLAWRARLAGWRCLLEPRARVYHVHSATLGQASPLKHYLLGRNKIWLVVKNYPMPWLLRYLPVILAYDLLSALMSAVRLRHPAPIRGRVDGLRRLPHFLRKRRRIQGRWQDVANWYAWTQPVASPPAVLQRYTHLR